MMAPTQRSRSPPRTWSERSTRFFRLWVLAVVLTLGASIFVMSQGGMFDFRETVEWVRLQVDRAVCTPAKRTPADLSAIDLGPQNCTHIPLPPHMRVPRMFVADEAFATTMNGLTCRECDELPVYDQIRRNLTGTLVNRVEDAEFIVLPFPAECHDSCRFNRQIDFRRAVDAMQPLLDRNPRAKLVTVSRRPFPERTNFRTPMRDLLANNPNIMFLSPEIKNLQSRELRSGAAKFSFLNHVILPQFPVDFTVFDAPFAPDWDRPYRFCFQGTLLNAERTMVTDALRQRNDSYVLSTCRSDRADFAATTFSSGDSATLYSQCQFCPTPRGDSNCDTRFFDAMRVGCIPIVTNAMRATPYIRHVDYAAWSLAYLRDTNAKRFAQYLDTLADQSPESIHRQRLRMREAALQITHAECNGAPGLHYALASLIEDRSGLEDLWGHSFQNM